MQKPTTTHGRSRWRAPWRLLTAAVVVWVTSVGPSAAAAGPTGPDVSRWQHTGPLSWSAVKASGHSFAFVKATEGMSYTNPHFRSDWSGTRAAGLIRGAYHYARPSNGSGAAQARRFIAVTGRLQAPGDLPPVLDLEVTGGLDPVRLSIWTGQFLAEVHRLTGRTAIIYTYPSFWRRAMAGTSTFTRHPLWIASYRAAGPLMPAWPTWTFWQHTDRGLVAGIPGPVDLNRFNGSLSQLRRMARYLPGPTITAALSQTSTTRGRPVTLTGSVQPALAGRTLYRQGYYAGAWHTWATTTIGPSGSYRFVIRPTVKAVNRYRVFLPAADGRDSGSSPVLTLTVK